ncbi:sodium- and chloride-dependent glycine transporter 2-like isoform X1 [Palaemon carinicauda]|uniref:sodium- and chloride-dependent glycine transporter 2-like isoform X1 n=1 Tax=Palaemon carinicauda TaxID=392227 RepID=UPI0035B5EAAC
MSILLYVKEINKGILKFFRKRLTAPLPERGTFKNWKVSVLSLIAYSVGLGNFWRFPYLCFKHKGLTFVIPYIIAMVFIGVPIYFLELALGQYVSLAPTQLFSYMCPALSGIGYGMILIIFAVAIYYNMMMAWSLYYLVASLNTSLNSTKPTLWETGNCTSNADTACHLAASKDYFMHVVLRTSTENITENRWDLRGNIIDQPTENGGDLGAGPIHVEMVFALAAAWFLIFVCLAKGVRNTSKVLIFTVFYPYVIMAFINVWSVSNSTPSPKANHTDGNNNSISLQPCYLLQNFLEINWTHIQANTSVWIDASAQVIYSLGIAQGGITTIASYNKINQNILRDTIIVCLLDSFTSVYCAYVVSSTFVCMSKEFLKNNENSPYLVFIVFPALVSGIGNGGLWSLLFFIMILALGFDTQLMGVETVMTALFDEWHILRQRYVAVIAACCFLLFLLGIPMTMKGGKEIFDMLDSSSTKHSLLLLCLLEVVIVAYIYGYKKFIKIIKAELKVWVPAPLYYFWGLTWLCLTPLSLLVLLGFSFYDEYEVWENMSKNNCDFDGLFYTGLTLSFSVFIIVSLRAAFILLKKWIKDGLKCENMSQTWKATSNFCPEYVRNGRDPDFGNSHLPEGEFTCTGV